MAQMNKLSSYQTTISQHAGGITVISYRGTAIVQFTDDWVKLQTCGWDTVTTRRKMNQASRQFGLGYSVYREKGVTKVCINHPDGTPYLNCGVLTDPMTINRRKLAA